MTIIIVDRGVQSQHIHDVVITVMMVMMTKMMTRLLTMTTTMIRMMMIIVVIMVSIHRGGDTAARQRRFGRSTFELVEAEIKNISEFQMVKCFSSI